LRFPNFQKEDPCTCVKYAGRISSTTGENERVLLNFLKWHTFSLKCVCVLLKKFNIDPAKHSIFSPGTSFVATLDE
jgi:hypothetical protein